MTESTADRARRVAALGPFFAFEAHDVGAAAMGPWRPLDQLVREPGALAERVASVRGRLAAGNGRRPEEVAARVAASVTHLGVVARLVSPLLAVAAAYGLPSAPGLAEMWWRPGSGGAFPLSLPFGAPADEGRPGRGLSEPVAAGLVDGALGQLVGVFAELSVSRRVLWGNVASAVNGAVAAAAYSAPGAAGPIRQAADVLLAQPALRAAHVRTGAAGAFRRRSCCLIYRAAPGGTGAVCGDCVLASRR
ncbi:(2Fe-2S)-binding protein [Streptantibioticus cattleyicolor]|uniref:Ferric siderophore reductase C-terminal domain-containing protein n=1 Tax=Streptantibioticus cattleyicolor (strain ATCC 35852 / DSM 46488 / JCM 4925 / NBRC 14057 / NRRL 8057) TaxID=1003195 RepID=F8JMJ1_STREN|nr:(2Fe-2S)-binding protein [Streptantibioticus cattleyicolor]AEW99327.1 hypothetical protein SCATT_p11340 [Streptantibioticus cattleyicolor NRRL 8057 = DSM 46488]CCB71633.1 conserved protein of unknown function [Streptantibioticus cattleyicolor NRRL 8057 = DSM 46488]